VGKGALHLRTLGYGCGQAPGIPCALSVSRVVDAITWAKTRRGNAKLRHAIFSDGHSGATRKRRAVMRNCASENP